MRYVTALFGLLALCACQNPEVQPQMAAGRAPHAAPHPEPGNAEAGRAFAQKNCSTCHAVAATGASPYAPAPPLRTLHEKYDVEGLAEAFAEGILVGHRGPKQMPEFVLTPEEIDDLLAYLKSFE